MRTDADVIRQQSERIAELETALAAQELRYEEAEAKVKELETELEIKASWSHNQTEAISKGVTKTLALQDRIKELEEAAREVVDSWESGDLAGAVTGLGLLLPEEDA